MEITPETEDVMRNAVNSGSSGANLQTRAMHRLSQYYSCTHKNTL